MQVDDSYFRDWIKLRITQLQTVRATAQRNVIDIQSEIEQYDYEISLLKGMLEGDIQ